MLVYLWVIYSHKLDIAQPVLALGLLGVMASDQRLRVPAPLLWFGGFLLWATSGAVASNHQASALEAVFEYWKIWLIFFLVCNTTRTKNQLRTYTVLWLGLFAAYPIRGALFNLLHGIADFGRVAWNFVFSNPNDLAALCLPMLALCAVVLQSEQGKWTRRAAWVGLFVLPVVIAGTQSRGGLLALATLGIFSLRTHRHKLRVALVLALVVGGILVTAPEGLWKRLSGLKGVTDTENLASVDPEGSAVQRWEIWKVATAVVADHPMWGVGIGTYGLAHQEYAVQSRFRPTAQGKRDAHNMFLSVLAETGFPGLALFVAMILSVILPTWRLSRDLAQSSPASATQLRLLTYGLLAFLQANLFATMPHLPFMYLYFGVMVSAVQISLVLQRQTGQSVPTWPHPRRAWRSRRPVEPIVGPLPK